MKRSIVCVILCAACAAAACAQNLYSPGATAQDVKNAAAAGADLEAVNKDGLTPLMYAAAGGNLDVMRALLGVGAKPDTENASGYTALAFAAYNQPNPEAVRILLGAGAAVDHANGSGMTPLMWAALKSSNPAVVDALIAGGADLTHRSSDGRSAYDCASGNDKVKASPVYAKLGARRTNDEKAREAYAQAVASASGGNHAAAVTSVDAAIALLGSTNIRLQPVLIRSLAALKSWPRARAELKTYFDIAKDTTLVEYGEMKDIGDSVDRALQQDEAGFQAAAKINEWQPWKAYLGSYPFALHADEANRALDAIEKADYAQAVRTNTIDGYATFLAKHTVGQFNRDIDTRRLQLIDEKDWSRARGADTKASYTAYQAAHPNGIHASEARQALQAIDKAERDKAAVQAQARREAQRAELTADLESQRAEASGHFAIGSLMLAGGIGLGAFAAWALYSILDSSSSDESSDNTLQTVGGGLAIGGAAWCLGTCADDFERGNRASESADETASELARLSVTVVPVRSRAAALTGAGVGLNLRVPLAR